jgi:hypothetical protein
MSRMNRSCSTCGTLGRSPASILDCDWRSTLRLSAMSTQTTVNKCESLRHVHERSEARYLDVSQSKQSKGQEVQAQYVQGWTRLGLPRTFVP